MTALLVERHPVQPGHERDFRSALEQHLDRMREADGVLWADAGETLDDGPGYLVLSEWRTAADLEAWERSGHRERFAEQTDPWVREAATARRFRGGG